MSHPCIKMTCLLYARMMAMLLDGHATCNEIADETGLGQNVVRYYIKHLYVEKVIYVSQWHEDTYRRFSVRAYTIGRHADAIRPPPQPTKLVKRRWRQRQKNAALLGLIAEEVATKNSTQAKCKSAV